MRIVRLHNPHRDDVHRSAGWCRHWTGHIVFYAEFRLVDTDCVASTDHVKQVVRETLGTTGIISERDKPRSFRAANGVKNVEQVLGRLLGSHHREFGVRDWHCASRSQSFAQNHTQHGTCAKQGPLVPPAGGFSDPKPVRGDTRTLISYSIRHGADNPLCPSAPRRPPGERVLGKTRSVRSAASGGRNPIPLRVIPQTHTRSRQCGRANRASDPRAVAMPPRHAAARACRRVRHSSRNDLAKAWG